MDDSSASSVNFAQEDDERFFATFPHAREAIPQWHMVQPDADIYRNFGSTGFYYGHQQQLDPYPQPDQYCYNQYSFQEPSSSLSYGTYASDLPRLSSGSELAQGIYLQQHPPLSDFSSGSSASPENALYSPIEETHQHYSQPSSALSSTLPVLPDPSEQRQDSLESKTARKRGRQAEYLPPESPPAYSIHKMSLDKHTQPPAPKVPKTRTPAHGEKKSLALACFFCRGRKIACGRQDPNSPDRTCNQCYRRSLKCEYPTESRRGMRKKKTVMSDGLRTLAAD